MNEQETADTLAHQLDALLAGEPISSTTSELAELLQIAEQVSATAPVPQPEFGSALKYSLLKDAFGNGAASGTAFTGWVIVIAVVSLLGLMTAIGLIVGFGTQDDQIAPGGNGSAPPAAPAKTGEGRATSLPVGATATDQVTESQPMSASTVIIDVIPSLTGTIEDTVELELPPGLVPGHDSGSGGDGRDGDGDHNRGHGNDHDHHDEDNPGRSRD